MWFNVSSPQADNLEAAPQNMERSPKPQHTPFVTFQFFTWLFLFLLYFSLLIFYRTVDVFDFGAGTRGGANRRPCLPA
jgi:hypothetical protein